jgi:hypothetical protein
MKQKKSKYLFGKLIMMPTIPLKSFEPEKYLYKEQQIKDISIRG